MFRTDRPGACGTGVALLLSAMPSISSRLEAASVLTSKTRRPMSAKYSATAVESDVLPTPPLPVKNRCRVGWCSRFSGRGLSQRATFSWEGTPPLCTKRPSTKTAGVALTPCCARAARSSILVRLMGVAKSCATRSIMALVLLHLEQPGPKTTTSIHQLLVQDRNNLRYMLSGEVVGRIDLGQARQPCAV